MTHWCPLITLERRPAGGSQYGCVEEKGRGMCTCSNISYSMEEKGKTKKGNVRLSRLVYVWVGLGTPTSTKPGKGETTEPVRHIASL